MSGFDNYKHLEPSARTAPAGTLMGPVDPQTQIHVSIYLKPVGENAPVDREDLAAQRAVNQADGIKLVSDFAAQAGLSVDLVDPGRRLIQLSGSAAAAQAAFRTTLSCYQDGGVTFRGREGTLQLPEALHGVVEAVLGLDTRAQAQTRAIVASAAVQAGYLPNVVAQIYNFPTTVTGAGQCIGLIELGGGFLQTDIDTAFSAMGLASPNVTAVSVDGGANVPIPDDGANAEVALDIQVAGGAAPGAAFAVYFAPNTDAGFVDAITQAVHDTTNSPSVISISWGSAEPNWTAQAVATMNSALQDAGTLGVSIFVAAGDNLSTDSVADGQVHVDFPAASPNAIGCGGTQLNASGLTVGSETVWNDGSSGTGGGISALFPVPGFQGSAPLPLNVSTQQPGRGVPDVAGNAAPGTGYDIVVNGQNAVVGGTSAVAPLWAGLTALINQQGAQSVGFFLPLLYGQSAGVREIVDGNNIPAGSSLGYSAGPGWNACTGLGVPDGNALMGLLAPAPAS